MIDNIEDNIENNINNIMNEIVDKIEYNELWEGVERVDNFNNSILCAICLEIIKEKNNCITSCGHNFCLSCILISSEYKNNCPCCREKLYSTYILLDPVEINNNEEDIREDEDDDDNIQIQRLLLNTTNNQNQNQQITEDQITLFNRLKNLMEYSYRFSYIFTTIKNGCIRTTKFVSFVILASFGIHIGIQLSNYFLYNVCKIE